MSILFQFKSLKEMIYIHPAYHISIQKHLSCQYLYLIMFFCFYMIMFYPHYGYASKEGKIEIVSKPIHVHKSKSNSFSFFSNLCNVLRKSNQQYFAQVIKPQNKGNKVDLWKLERKFLLHFFEYCN